MTRLSAICPSILLLLLVASAHSAKIRLDVTRDTWVSSVDREANANLGGAPQLKLKSIQEMSLIDIDPTPLNGHVIRSAVLHVRKSGKETLHRVTISSISSDWVEGTSRNYQPQNGSSCFNLAKYPDTPWAYPGSDLTAVTLGQGGTIWNSSEASPGQANDGWLAIPISPALLAARVAGISYGFLLFDDTGSEWTRDMERFNLRLFPNRFVFSREAGKNKAPYITVELGPEDHQPPEPPSQLTFSIDDLPAGEAEITWLTPKDHGEAGVSGFIAEVDGKRVPQYLVPAPSAAGNRVTMHLRDLGLSPGQHIHLTVRAVDGAGNLSDPSALDLRVSSEVPPPLPGKDPTPFVDGGPLPRLGNTEIAIIDTLDKYMPSTSQIVPPQSADYLSANHLWSAKEKRISLHAARNEFVSFQILIRGPVKELRARADFAGEAKPTVNFFQIANIDSKQGPIPDPLLPMHGFYSTAGGPDSGSLLCEMYVPHELAPGSHSGKLTLSIGDTKLTLGLELTVWNFTLPDHLSFIPELNCYDLPSNELEYYRLAHLNRTVINRVPYHQDGSISPGCAPKWNGKTLDWSSWDERFTKFFDGSAFADLPRKSVPLDIFYLPLHENWPTPMEGNYDSSYWADQAFPASYRQAFVECSRQFAQHFNRKNWDDIRFLCFFNGKNNFKQRGWSHSSCPWLLDEPTNFQDFWALHWFGVAFHEGAALSPGPAKMLFRCDISRPQWQRDLLDDVLNYNVVSGDSFHRYHRLVMERKRRLHQLIIPYGSTNSPADSNVQPLAWCWDNWTLGADGVLPWQVIGNTNSWKTPDPTCLFYPGSQVGQKEPIASIRLKAYLRGEQDAEYLTLLSKLEKLSQLEVGKQIRALLPLRSQRKRSDESAEEAGTIDFGNLLPQDLWRLREQIARSLSN